MDKKVMDKSLKKLSKKELLEMLFLQSNKIEELNSSLNIVQKKLEDKKILISNSGSIAEAALKINNIFEKAQKTADQYLYNIKNSHKK